MSVSAFLCLNAHGRQNSYVRIKHKQNPKHQSYFFLVFSIFISNPEIFLMKSSQKMKKCACNSVRMPQTAQLSTEQNKICSLFDDHESHLLNLWF